MLPALGILLGAVLLGQAFRLFTRVVADLPPGLTRTRWQVLRMLVVLLILAYVVHALLALRRGLDLDVALIAIVFLMGASFVVIVAGLSAQTVQDLQRMTVLELASMTDPLTGLYNRRYLDQRCREEIERARRYGLPLSALLVDIDHFKQVNDVHGHQAGDVVLTAMAALIRATVRSVDIVVRYGGEEFLILLPHTEGAAAARLAERLRAEVARFAFTRPPGSAGGAPLSCTVSIGVAVLDPGVTGADGLIAAADAALYEAKQAGRNRVVAR